MTCMKSKMSSSRYMSSYSIFIIFFISLTPVFAIEKKYIVYLGSHSHGPDLEESDLQKVSDYHHEFLSSFLGSKEKAQEAIIHSYRRSINGFCAKLDEKVADEIRKHDDVVSVFLNQQRKPMTTHAWEFLTSENNNLVPSSSLWKKANFGEDIIIGSLDSGVWPESKSFSDEGYGPIPKRWKGKCDNGVDMSSFCNRKIIGASYYKDSLEASMGHKLHESLNSPRDLVGHGTHTLSIAAGNFVNGVNVIDGAPNNSFGTAKGGAPRARVSIYKVCWHDDQYQETCDDGDVFKGLDHAIYDGVDVIICSLGMPAISYLEDALAMATMTAIKYDVMVVTAGGNEGPKPATISNVSPWTITVAASTMDREFQSYVELGNGLRLKGVSISRSMPQDKLYPIVSGVAAKTSTATVEEAMRCDPPALDPAKVKGKILVCMTDGAFIFETSMIASDAGAVSLILFNDEKSGPDLRVQHHLCPVSTLTHKDGLVLLHYIDSTPNPMGIVKATTQQLNTKPAPVMAFFSSKGPNTITPEILKPDVTAPGVDIVGAFTGAANPTDLAEKYDNRRLPYVVQSGTSMAAPFVAALVANLKAIHPKWSPAALKSAIMTTASPVDNTGHPILNAMAGEATPFDYGAGQIQPDRAADPGLVYDLKMIDYINFLCVSGYNKSSIQKFYHHPYICPPYSDALNIINLNYPSITVPKLKGSVVVSRKLKNVGPPATYVANIIEPKGVSISVEPKVLEFKTTGDQERFKLTLTSREQGGQHINNGYVFGSLTWSDGFHTVRSPITVGFV